jgi:hypothetical protein
MSVWCRTLAGATPEKNLVCWHGVPVGIDWLLQSFRREVVTRQRRCQRHSSGYGPSLTLALSGPGNDKTVRVWRGLSRLTTIWRSFLLHQAHSMSELEV